MGMQPGALPFPRKELSPREALAVSPRSEGKARAELRHQSGTTHGSHTPAACSFPGKNTGVGCHCLLRAVQQKRATRLYSNKKKFQKKIGPQKVANGTIPFIEPSGGDKTRKEDRVSSCQLVCPSLGGKEVGVARKASGNILCFTASRSYPGHDFLYYETSPLGETR